ncbi:MAG TPA: sulfotransferase [Conexibacter sp.]|nr:sulfotransferase [Conexibacter sp.]
MSVSAPSAVTGERLVFVAGLHRSGTTPLARWLVASPHVAGLRDTGVWEDEGQHLQDLLPTAIDHGGPGRFAFARGMHEVETSPRATPALARRLVEAWTPYWDLERPLLLEKSPPNLLRTRLLQALFPGAAFVVVIRHPVAVALATEKWIRRPARWVAAPSLLRHWLRAHELFLADAPRLERLIVVRYEELTADPGAVLRRVGAFLGLSEPPPVPADVTHGADDGYFAAWRSLRPAPRRALAAAAPLAFERRVARFGYSLRDLRARPAPDPLLA